MYKLAKREEILKQLIEALPEGKEKSKKKLYLIDRSFRHAQMQEWSKAERSIFQETVNDLIERERMEMKAEHLIAQKEEVQQMEQSLNSFVQNLHGNKTLHLQSKPEKNKHSFIHDFYSRQKKVYIQRKYNHKLSYQIHSIIQAKRIEQQKEKMKIMLSKTQESPLINHVKKLTRSERNSFSRKKGKKTVKFQVVNDQGDFAKKLKKYFNCHSKTLLHNQRIREAIEEKQNFYQQRSLVPNTANSLRKYNSTMHITKHSGRKRVNY